MSSGEKETKFFYTCFRVKLGGFNRQIYVKMVGLEKKKLEVSLEVIKDLLKL